jgi:DNA-binding transcriptional regulator YiaG
LESRAENRDETNLIRKVCKEYQITQTELSKRLEVPRGTLGRWVSEDNIPRGFEIALKLMLENKKLRKQLKALELFKEAIREMENI